MTERQEHLLRVMSDPVNHIDRLRKADRDAIGAALDEITVLREREERAFAAIRQLITAFAIEKAVSVSTVLNWAQLPIFATDETRKVFRLATLQDLGETL